MALSEFELIDRYFRRASARDDVVAGVGDDAAVLRVRTGQELVVATDTIVEDVHFPIGTSAADIGYRALAVNLSDLAAMGAEPAWASLALTCPDANDEWLQGFASGFFELADAYSVQLIGGDTTRGPLTVTVTVHGWVRAGCALLRSGARAGDSIFVSGTLGDAAAGLAVIKRGAQGSNANAGELSWRFRRPQPRVRLGQFLLPHASSAIDISDGFAADLGHVLMQSGVGAVVVLPDVPVSEALASEVPREQAIEFAVNGGDDYELCFTVPVERMPAFQSASAECGVKLSRVGTIVAPPGLRFVDRDGVPVECHTSGYCHF